MLKNFPKIPDESNFVDPVFRFEVPRVVQHPDSSACVQNLQPGAGCPGAG